MTAMPADTADAASDAMLDDAAATRAMVERLDAANRHSTAAMLEELRRSFPDSPLSMRVRALAALRRRQDHNPR